MSTPTLLPCGNGLAVECVSNSADTIIIQVRTTSSSACCSLCGHASRRVHSRYGRILADLPWNTLTVRIRVSARKFFCLNPACERRIFTEPLPDLARRYARKTLRLADTLLQLTHLLGGEAAARIARLLGLLLSPAGLLKRLKKVSGHRLTSKTPRVLGLDDFAFRRGTRYGTLLLDLETRQPIDMLPDREGRTVETWLKEHSGIEIVSRDRSRVFADAVTQAAPQAKQVADRFHLVHNLMEALEKQVKSEYNAIRQTLDPPAPVQEDEGFAPLTRRQERAREQSRQQRLERWQKVRDLGQQGYAKKEIARMLSLDVHTVRDYLRSDTFPERRSRSSPPGKLDAYRDFMLQRWEEGCHNALQLWRELKAQGFSGGATAVRDFVRPLRQTEGVLAPRRAKRAVPSVRSLTWLLVREKDRTPEQTQMLETLFASCPALTTSRQLVQDFRALLKSKVAADLQPWLQRAKESKLTEFVTFARGIEADLVAVEAAITEKWSNGPTEGHVNRLKFVKRQGYGRAGFALLKARVLPLTA